MPGQRQRVKLDGILIAIMALLVPGGLIALGFLRNISGENRALVVMAISIGMIGCFAGLIFLSAFRRRLRKRIWLRAMAAWNESSRARNSPNFIMTGPLVEDGLRQLAIQVYSQMGYRIANREAEDGYLQLINPNGMIELIACKQQPDLLELHHVYSLYLEMNFTKAVRGFFWAPAGFTSEALGWVLHRPIVLADGDEIGRLADCAHLKGSRFLEY